MATIYRRISQSLLNLGIAPNLRGYYYLKNSINQCLLENQIGYDSVRRAQEYTANRFQKSLSNLQAAESRAILHGWDYRDMKLSEEIFGKNGFGKRKTPTSRQLIYAISTWIKRTENVD